jgi:hypothetical protein
MLTVTRPWRTPLHGIFGDGRGRLLKHVRDRVVREHNEAESAMMLAGLV